MIEESRLKVEFLSSAFFIRHKGLLLENFAWWLRMNLFFGAFSELARRDLLDGEKAGTVR